MREPLADVRRRAIVAAICLVAAGCDGGDGEEGVSPGATTATVVIHYTAPTAPRTDLPAGAQACVQGVDQTHTHPSWRAYAAFPLQAAGANRWQITFTDVPVNATVAFRINDPNACDENPTGAVTRNIFANDVRLTTMVTTPGSGPEPGFSFQVSAGGQVRP